MTAPVAGRLQNEARPRPHTHRSVELVQRSYGDDQPPPFGLRPSRPATALRLSPRTLAITFKPRLVSERLGQQRRRESAYLRFPIFDRLTDFPHSEIDTVIPLPRIIRQSIKSSTDLTHQLVQHPGSVSPRPHANAIFCGTISLDVCNSHQPDGPRSCLPDSDYLQQPFLLLCWLRRADKKARFTCLAIRPR